MLLCENKADSLSMNIPCCLCFMLFAYILRGIKTKKGGGERREEREGTLARKPHDFSKTPK